MTLHYGLLKQLNVTGDEGIVAKTLSVGVGPVDEAKTSNAPITSGRHSKGPA